VKFVKSVRVVIPYFDLRGVGFGQPFAGRFFDNARSTASSKVPLNGRTISGFGPGLSFSSVFLGLFAIVRYYTVA
jgi:hypothetical protein